MPDVVSYTVSIVMSDKSRKWRGRNRGAGVGATTGRVAATAVVSKAAALAALSASREEDDSGGLLRRGRVVDGVDVDDTGGLGGRDVAEGSDVGARLLSKLRGKTGGRSLVGVTVDLIDDTGSSDLMLLGEGNGVVDVAGVVEPPPSTL